MKWVNLINTKYRVPFDYMLYMCKLLYSCTQQLKMCIPVYDSKLAAAPRWISSTVLENFKPCLLHK